MRSGGSRRGARGCRAPLSLDQTEVQKAEKNFFETTPPNLSQGLDDPPPPLLSEGLDPPLMRSTVLRSKVVSR